MRHHFLSSGVAMPSSSSVRKLGSPSDQKNCPFLCREFTSATLDLLIFILVLFSGAFLIISYFSYLLHSLSLILPTVASNLSSGAQSQLLFLGFFATSFAAFVFSFEICFRHRSRRCGKKGCKGLKKAMEFDLQIQGEDLLGKWNGNKSVREVNDLPWKGGTEDNPDYECLRSELRKMAPNNGRAVLLFRNKCGCPVAKLEGWAPKRGRRHKKSLVLTNGGGDHRKQNTTTLTYRQ